MKLILKKLRDTKQLISNNRFLLKRRFNKVYKKEDPWNYKSNPEDIKRKDWIIGLAKKFCPDHRYKKALDIEAGEGWITTDLPAEEIYGYDVSDIAMSRFPSNIKPLHNVKGRFDLIIATGVLYESYGYKWIIDKINKCASCVAITCNIKKLEYGIDRLQGKQVFCDEFSYRNYVEIIRVFKY